MPARTPASAAATGPRLCDGAPGEQHCCGLECLVRPRYFCGQLLTDADQNAAVDYSRARLALARYRHGWGVVCGLEVVCDPHDPAGVIVRPGYALDPCGNDVVVCEPERVSLARLCPRAGCFDPRGQKAREADRAMVPLPSGLPGDMFAAPRLIDLSLHFDEAGAEPQAALRRGGCGQAECENSRMREGCHVAATVFEPQAGDAQAEPDTDTGTRSKGLLAVGAQTLVNELTSWVQTHLPWQFGFAYQWVENRARTLTGTERLGSEWSEAVFWLYFDSLLGELACGCPRYDQDAGVPLARIWLEAETTERPCRVMGILGQPPYRRPLRLDDCPPAPDGFQNLAHLLGCRRNDVIAELRARGIPFKLAADATLANWAWQVSVKQSKPVVPLESEVTIVCVDLGVGWEQRVVALYTSGSA